MKKVVFLLFLSLLFLLAGCGGPQYISGDGGHSTDSVSETVHPETPLHPCKRISFRFENFSKVFSDPSGDGKDILIFNAQTPIVFIEGNNAAAETINRFFTELDKTYFSNSDFGLSTEMDLCTYLQSLAEDYYTLHSNSADDGLDYLFTYNRTVTVLRADDEYISVLYSIIQHTPSGDSEESQIYSFKTQSGELVNDSISDNSSDVSELYCGSLELKDLATFQNGSAAVEDLVIINENGEEYIAIIYGSIADFSICELESNGTDVGFSIGKTLYFTNVISNSAIQLRYSLPQNIADLCICYLANGVIEQYAVKQDTVSGSISIEPLNILSNLG